LHLSRLLAAGGALTLLAALFATGGCTTVVAPEAGGGGGGYDGGTGADGGGSSSSGGGGSSGSSSGGFSDAAAACLPGDVTTYAPQYRPATGAYLGQCSDDDVKSFFSDCLGSTAMPDACNAFMNDAGAGCAACLLTPDSDPKYGPLIGHGSFVTANIAGCIELTDATTNGLACAKAVQALGGCELLACEANCDVHDSQSLNSYDTCASTADQAGCETYASASSCVQSLQEAGDGVAQCLASDFATFYYAAAQLFCGTAPAVDAGAPPYDAGSPAPDGSTASD
jgi:hypothetical protein